jgi:hypothetical protein
MPESRNILPMWVVYDHPKDWPEFYVARKWMTGGSPDGTPTDHVIMDRDLENLRRTLWRLHLVKLDRMEGDNPVILETWI